MKLKERIDFHIKHNKLALFILWASLKLLTLLIVNEKIQQKNAEIDRLEDKLEQCEDWVVK